MKFLQGIKIIFLFLKLNLFIILSSSYDPDTCITCRKSHMCNPPDCFCCRDEMPVFDQKIPQMVFFTFDDAVNPPVAKFYRELFDASRTNPNGCPIKMTLFISHSNTVYSLVREFYKKGMEIASHSVTHSNPDPRTFLNEAKNQKENLAKKAKIPESEIKGWRSPFLKPLGDKQPDILKQLGYEYDATLTIIKSNSLDMAPLPFTLDYGWPYDCKIKPCPAKEHKGFWEVPVISVKDYLNKYNCVYIDGCNIPPPSEALAYKFLWDNFENYYKTNRAPMGINMHASWFYYPDRKQAMSRFIQDILKLGDVYIVTVSQVIAWLRNPTPLSGIKEFQPWRCDGKNASTVPPPKVYDLRTQSLQDRQRENVLQVKKHLDALKQQAMAVQKEKYVTQNSRTTPVRQGVANIRPTQAPVRQNIINIRQLPTGTPQRTLSPAQYLRGLQNALVIRPAQSPVRQSVINMRPPQVRVQQGTMQMRPQISNVVPSQVPLFPWTRQQFLRPTPGAPPPPPLNPNYPFIRFWWRPPEMALPNPHPNVHIVRPQQRVLPQQNFMQQNMRRYQVMERQRQLARQQVLGRQQLEERKRQENLKRQQELKKIQELHKQKEMLQQQELERQRLAELKRQGELKRKQEEEMKRKLLQQKEMEMQRLAEMKRHQEQERIRIEKMKQEELKRQESQQKLQNSARENALRKQMQMTQHNLLQEKRLAEQQREAQTIQQMKQLAETNFKRLVEMERQHNSIVTTTVAPRIRSQLRGRSMWQMDTADLKQLNAPWQNWVGNPQLSSHSAMSSHLQDVKLREFNAVPVKKSAKKNSANSTTMNTFKPQTVFSVSDFKGPKSFSVYNSSNYAKNAPLDIQLQTLENWQNKQIHVAQSTSIRETTTTPTSKTTQSFVEVTTVKKTTSTEPQTTTSQNIIKVAPPAKDNLKVTSTKKYIKVTLPSQNDLKLSSTQNNIKVTPAPQNSLKVTSTENNIKALLANANVKFPKTEKSMWKNIFAIVKKQSKPVSAENAKITSKISLRGRCTKDENCRTPNCLCKSVSPPNRLLPKNTPQIVYITVDGSIDFHSYSNIEKIFDKTRVNPNGCPIKGTLFSVDANSNYLLTKMLHSKGFEIAMKGLKGTSYSSPETLMKDIHLQKQRLAKNANVPASDVTGWRSPELKPLGDKQFEILRNLSLYDSTLIPVKNSPTEPKLWPFTLDYGWKEGCEIEKCPKGNHPGVWEVPVIPVSGPNNSRSCEYIDSCTNQPSSEQETVDFLMDNFNQYYKSSRAPFAIRLQQVWFHWYYAKNLSGLIKFLDEILKLGDVYVNSVANTLEWMKNPTSLEKIRDFKPWSCGVS